MPFLAALLLVTPFAPPTDRPQCFSAVGGAMAIAEVRVRIISGTSVDARSWRPAGTPHQRETSERVTGALLRLTEFE
ncbi:hypothetical protein [Sphingomonas sp.]|uniref:hypothetical protein n=1 Tax=Sphingomonas sp. TaxID=28214 RepID=UPI00286BF074|nr:hypothetical protein [Sphingomonas sp.]